MRLKLIMLAVILTAVGLFTAGKITKDVEQYKDPKLPVEDRVSDLLKRMTLEEKIDLLAGTGFATKPIERLGIPELRMTDGPLGVRWENSTAFPSGIALGASWEPELAQNVGQAIAREVKSKGRHVILGPCVNIARIPQGGRNFESYGEDPWLTTSMAVPYIKGVQSENVVATVKHFACNNQEFQRDFVDVKIDERALNEIYLPSFKASVQNADVWAVMCSYNKVNGHYASENDYLLVDKLKKEWGFNYLVMSDWGAVHSSLPVVNSGLDLEMPDGVFLNRKTLTEAVNSGKIPVSQIDDKVKRILRVIFKLGLFENPGKPDMSLLGTKENLKAAYEGARGGIVLLKNDNSILPLNMDKVKSIAVIGPNANELRAGGGGSSQVSPITSASPLEVLKNKFGNKVKFTFAEGARLQGDAAPVESSFLTTDASGKEHGLMGEYFSNMELKGTPAFTRIDKQVSFDWGGDAPKPDFQKDDFSVRWSGFITVPNSGEYILDVTSDDGERLYLDGKQLLDDWKNHAPESHFKKVRLEGGRPYSIRLEYYESKGGAVVKLGWRQPAEELISEAVKAAASAEIALIFAGTNYHYETEGRDRDDLQLPDEQDQLIQAVSKVNKNTVVILSTGSPVLMDSWINNVNGIIETWFGGEEMGSAIADVISGAYNPGGKLPLTFPHKWEDCSAFKTYKSQDSVTYYSDGIYLGYRHFEKNNIKPLFPFGFGLSYTSFQYGKLKISPEKASGEGKMVVSFSIKNSGKVAGAEVAQLYLHDVVSSVDRPFKELKGYQKVFLNPGEEKVVKLTLDKAAMSYFDEKTRSWVAEPGDFEVFIGASSEDIRLNGKFTLK